MRLVSRLAITLLSTDFRVGIEMRVFFPVLTSLLVSRADQLGATQVPVGLIYVSVGTGGGLLAGSSSGFSGIQ